MKLVELFSVLSDTQYVEIIADDDSLILYGGDLTLEDIEPYKDSKVYYVVSTYDGGLKIYIK